MHITKRDKSTHKKQAKSTMKKRGNKGVEKAQEKERVNSPSKKRHLCTPYVRSRPHLQTAPPIPPI
jgi:hypothetical protein